MKRSNPEQAAAQAVGTWSEMVTALGIRKGVRHISQKLGLSQSSGSKECGFAHPNTEAVLGNTNIPPACCWAHSHSELKMEVFCWMLLIAKHHKPKSFILKNSLHPRSQGCDSGVELKVLFGKGGLLTSGIRLCIPAIPVG